MREKLVGAEAKIESLDKVRNNLITLVGKDIFVRELVCKGKYNEYTATVISVNKNILCLKPKDKLIQKAIILTDLLIGKVEINAGE